MKNPKETPVSTATTIMVGAGKSSRLQEMREKAMAARQTPVVNEPQQALPSKLEKHLSPELIMARQLIDQRLAEILAGLPAGKQRTLFKIRFGVELEQIKSLPMKRVISLLKIAHPDYQPLSPVMKRIAELDYEGDLVD